MELTEEERKERRRYAWKAAVRQSRKQDPAPSEIAWKTQRFRSCPSLVNTSVVVLSLYILGFVFIPTGVLLLLTNLNVESVTKRYDDGCYNATLCAEMELELEIPNEMQPPVDVFVRMTGFYQNYRRYANSRNAAQLRGEYVASDSLSACDPYIEDDNSQIYLPCGLFPSSALNDTLELLDPSRRPIYLNPVGIAWEADSTLAFGNPLFDVEGTRILHTGQPVRDLEDERFITWMRTAAFPTFLKKYAVVDQVLPAGTYRLRVANIFPTKSFSGEKWVVMQTRSWLGGGSNPTMAIMYLLIGSLMLLFAAIFTARYCTASDANMDPRYLEWAAQNKPVIVPGRIRAYRDALARYDKQKASRM